VAERGAKTAILVGLLPLLVAGGAWALVNGLPAPGDPDRAAGRVPPFVAVDSSGNGNDGIIQGDTVVGLPGRYGTSYTFVRRGSWVQVPSAPDINPGTRDFLVTVWVEFDEFPGPGETYDLVRKGVSYTTPGEFKLEVLPGGLVRCTAKDESKKVVTATSIAAIPDDETWHQIGCARTGEVWSVLVDDALRAHVVDLGAVANTVPLSIGAKYGLEDRPRGRVDDVKLFFGPRSDLTTPTEPDVLSAIDALEQGSPAGWWRLDEAATRAAGR
jgi:hypothetical protein